LQLITSADLDRITDLIKNYGLAISFGSLRTEDIIIQMRKDKKNVGGKIKLILPTAIGQSKIFDDISEAQVAEILNLKF
jgi:3-dehydroquinate synthase